MKSIKDKIHIYNLDEGQAVMLAYMVVDCKTILRFKTVPRSVFVLKHNILATISKNDNPLLRILKH